jgi:hypothetical protein
MERNMSGSHTEYLVKDGKSEYAILIPYEKTENEFLVAASKDLQKFILEATGVSLPILTDRETEKTEKVLSIGSTRLEQAAGIAPSVERLGIGGAVIKTVGNNVYMTGATDEAAMYATYLFLERELDFDLFYTDFYSLKKNVTEWKLPDYDLTEIPDFEYRIQSSGWIRYNHLNKKRMRWTENSQLFIPADGQNAVWHNTFTYLPPEEYKEQHPKWYSDPDASQLCYSAHGDEEERQQMIEIVAQKIILLFQREEFKDRRFISVSIQDNTTCCNCPSCLAAKEKYHADSGLIVRFTNEVSRKVKAWMDSEEGAPYKRDYRILFFAYHATNEAPVLYHEESDSFTASDPSVICDDNVAVYFAETGGDYTQTLRDKGTANTVVGDHMRAWNACAKEIYFWSYSTNFFWFFTPYNSFEAVQDIYRFAHEQGCRYIMTQDQWIQANAQTGWGIYKNWLHAKLGWHVEVDVPALREKFFRAYFGAAAQTMLALHQDWLNWSHVQIEELGVKGAYSIYRNPMEKAMWPKEKLDKWLAYIRKAYGEIESEKQADPFRYEKLKEHICIESIDYRYLLIELYSECYSKSELLALKRDTVEDIRRIGMDKAGAKVGDMTALCAKWGL